MRLSHAAFDNNSSATTPDPANEARQAQHVGIPASISLVARNLIECGNEHRPENAYECLDGAVADLHLLLLDPCRFLFDRAPPAPGDGAVPPLFRTHRLYGREDEVSRITDAFCRVSSGRSEAFFIGGFSGSGKSRLVSSLAARIDVAEGYVLVHKFDQRSKENPLLEVISVFNDLCLLIRDKRTTEEVETVSATLAEVFGSDLPMLAQLLPNVTALSPRFRELTTEEEIGEEDWASNVGFVLQRFMRVVSSASHPVVLHLDDLQWCPSLAVVEEILMGRGAVLLLFGSYRSNEISDDHILFRFMRSLAACGVPATELGLEGLRPPDLNAMVSDSLGTLPRICQPLSDIVYQKTNGNPLFAQAFLRSLVDDGLLGYSFPEGKWVWDEDRIVSLDVAANVLDLLSSKMRGLSEDVKLTLKVASCFGTKTKDCLFRCLSATSQYSGIFSGMEQSIHEGFFVKVGASGYEFVHDKVREAACSLIPASEKNQFHFCIGMTLFNTTKGSDIDDILFSVANQINHGVHEIQCPELRCDLSELNEAAGIKAARCSDYVTSRSYFNTALSLLPRDHWESHYDRSLRLYFRFAKSTYSSGDGTEANSTLRDIICRARCLGDKLKSYYHLILILFDREQVKDAFATACDVLSQLGEEIPDCVGEEETKRMLKMTSMSLSCVSEACFLETNANTCVAQSTGRDIGSILEFYNILALLSFVFKQELTPVFVCRMVQLSMAHPFLSPKHRIMGFLHFSAMVCCRNSSITEVQDAMRIIPFFKQVKFDLYTDLGHSAFLLYYSFIAPESERLQVCVENLQKGFESRIARGERTYAFVNATQDIRISLIMGEELPKILKRTEYYLGVIGNYSNIIYSKSQVDMFRDHILALMGREHIPEAREDNTNVDSRNYFKAVICFWMGHTERCHYFTEKFLAGKQSRQYYKRFIMLYYGVNAIKMIASRKKTTLTTKEIPRDALRTLKGALQNSYSNFCNKVHLLEAEIFSFEGSHGDASASYAASIKSAQCNHLIHEEGLAWELQGVHYNKIGDCLNARNAFHHAKQCYSKWGSQVKVDSITHQIESVQVA